MTETIRIKKWERKVFYSCCRTDIIITTAMNECKRTGGQALILGRIKSINWAYGKELVQ